MRKAAVAWAILAASAGFAAGADDLRISSRLADSRLDGRIASGKLTVTPVAEKVKPVTVAVAGETAGAKPVDMRDVLDRVMKARRVALGQ